MTKKEFTLECCGLKNAIGIAAKEAVRSGRYDMFIHELVEQFEEFMYQRRVLMSQLGMPLYIELQKYLNTDREIVKLKPYLVEGLYNKYLDELLKHPEPEKTGHHELIRHAYFDVFKLCDCLAGVSKVTSGLNDHTAFFIFNN